MKCQLLLRTPPLMFMIVLPSALTMPSPTSSNRPVAGLIDHKSNIVPGAQPAVLGKFSGTGCVNCTGGLDGDDHVGREVGR